MNFKLKKKNFTINYSEGARFSKKSGDYNPIHINKLYGYNSMFGKNIVHGVLIIEKLLNHIEFFNVFKIKEIKVDFIQPAEYKKKINIKFKSNKDLINFFLTQDKTSVTNISLKFIKNIFQEKKNFFNKDLNLVLNKISYYVGMKYPGENSLLKSILITNSKIKNSKIKIKSKLLDKRLPIINNLMHYKNFKVNFVSLIRPSVIKKKVKPNMQLKKIIKQLDENVLILGASQGIGNDLFNLISSNKKIYTIGSYFKNKPLLKKKNQKLFKIDVNKNIAIIKNLVEKYSPIKIYYFVSPKILFEKKVSIKKLNEFKKYFVDIPLKILKLIKKNKISFFYPSTDFIDFENKAPYSITKKNAEVKLLEFCKKSNIKFLSHRFPGINSRQSISFSSPKNQTLIEYLNKNQKIANNLINI
tara:strand:+ start:15806 stop:17050 length:1245 start_codon:yes stop_codon:yes gene_type:complete